MKGSEKKQVSMLKMFNKLSIDSKKSKSSIKKNKSFDKSIEKLSEILKHISIPSEEEQMEELLDFIKKDKLKK